MPHSTSAAQQLQPSPSYYWNERLVCKASIQASWWACRWLVPEGSPQGTNTALIFMSCLRDCPVCSSSRPHPRSRALLECTPPAPRAAASPIVWRTGQTALLVLERGHKKQNKKNKQQLFSNYRVRFCRGAAVSWDRVLLSLPNSGGQQKLDHSTFKYHRSVMLCRM